MTLGKERPSHEKAVDQGAIIGGAIRFEMRVRNG